MFCGNKPSYGNNSAYVTVFSKLKRMEEIRKALAEDLLALEKKKVLLKTVLVSHLAKYQLQLYFICNLYFAFHL